MPREAQRTMSPVGKFTPTENQIGMVAEADKIGKYDPELVRDVWNVLSDGEILPESRIREKAREAAMAMPLTPSKKSAKSKPEYRIKGVGSFENINEAQNALVKREEERYIANAEFLRGIKKTDIPGETATEKALNFYRIANAANGGTMDRDAANKARGALDAANSLPEGLLGDDGGELGQGGSDETGAVMMAEKVARDFRGSAGQLREMTKVARLLGKVSNLKARNLDLFNPEPLGMAQRGRPMKSIAELSRLGTKPLAIRNRSEALFRYQMVNRTYRAKERGEHTEKRQLMFMVVDCSGSMGHESRFYQAGGVLINRLKAVVDGDAELWYAFFDHDYKRDTLQHAGTPEEAQKLARHVLYGTNFSGGGTCIQNGVNGALREIEKIREERGDEMQCPDIMLVSDGDDTHLSLTKKDMNGVRLHACFIGGRNDYIRGLVASTGGTLIHLSDTAHCY